MLYKSFWDVYQNYITPLKKSKNSHLLDYSWRVQQGNHPCSLCYYSADFPPFPLPYVLHHPTLISGCLNSSEEIIEIQTVR